MSIGWQNIQPPNSSRALIVNVRIAIKPTDTNHLAISDRKN